MKNILLVSFGLLVSLSSYSGSIDWGYVPSNVCSIKVKLVQGEQQYPFYVFKMTFDKQLNQVSGQWKKYSSPQSNSDIGYVKFSVIEVSRKNSAIDLTAVMDPNSVQPKEIVGLQNAGNPKLMYSNLKVTFGPKSGGGYRAYTSTFLTSKTVTGQPSLGTVYGTSCDDEN